MEDKVIACRECKSDFVWTAKEQEFFAEKGFYAPKRCKNCIHTGYRADDGLTADERQKKYDEEHPNE